VDLKFDENLDDSGFDYGFDAMARLDYRVNQFWGGKLTVGVVYDYKYQGFTQFDAPTNQSKQGGVDTDWERTSAHAAMLQLRLSF
jgi:hypothetical protein